LGGKSSSDSSVEISDTLAIDLHNMCCQ
jgi:hypothetical protein